MLWTLTYSRSRVLYSISESTICASEIPFSDYVHIVDMFIVVVVQTIKYNELCLEQQVEVTGIKTGGQRDNSHFYNGWFYQ